MSWVDRSEMMGDHDSEEESAAPEQQELPPSMALLFGMLLDDAEAVHHQPDSAIEVVARRVRQNDLRDNHLGHSRCP